MSSDTFVKAKLAKDAKGGRQFALLVCSRLVWVFKGWRSDNVSRIALVLAVRHLRWKFQHLALGLRLWETRLIYGRYGQDDTF